MLDSTRAELLAAIEGLTPEQMNNRVVGEWTIKDLLAHVAVWEEQLLPDFRRVRDGHEPVFNSFRQADIDKWNEVLMSLRRNFSPEQAVHELAYCRQATLVAMDALPDDLFTYGFVPVTCAISARHDREHARQIEEWRWRAGI